MVNQHLDDIEDVAEFYEAIDRKQLTHQLSADRPYTYWTMELYDQENGIRGGGGLGILAADTRRIAEQLNVPLTLITPFYPIETYQVFEHGENYVPRRPVDYHKFGFKFVDTVTIKCNGQIVTLDIVMKEFGSTRILCMTEPNFSMLYSGASGSDHRLYQEVALGFGGYQALKILGVKPAIMQLNEEVAFFGALARLDEVVANGMDFYEAMVYTRKHTLYTNHTLVQAAGATFSHEQFQHYVFPNLKSPAVRKWLEEKFYYGQIRLSDVTIDIAELKSGVSKLHARVADYRDFAGNKVKFDAITNGIDMNKWVNPETIAYYREQGIIDKFYLPTADYAKKVEKISADTIKHLKNQGRYKLNQVLQTRIDQYGKAPEIPPEAMIFTFKRRFVDYKRPLLPFTNPQRLGEILEKYNGHYVLTGRVHNGDKIMFGKLKHLFYLVENTPSLKGRVHYLPDYDEKLAQALTLGAQVAINTPIVGLEACGTSWMKDIANFGLLVSTHDGGVADLPPGSYLGVTGRTEAEEAESLYVRLEEAAAAWGSDFDLEYWVHKQLTGYLPIISGTRMMRDYLDFLFN